MSQRPKIISTLLPVIALFLAGVAFAHFVILPPAMDLFIRAYNTAAVRLLISPEISLRASSGPFLLFGGLIFAIPGAILALVKIKVVTPQWLSARRGIWVMTAFIFAALNTSTVDPLSQCITAIILILSLELGILLAKLADKKQIVPKGYGESASGESTKIPQEFISQLGKV